MPRWVLAASLISTVVIALAVGVVWYVIGGWPLDHDRYGRVAIPGRATVVLPKGEARLSFDGQVTGGGRARTLEDPPEGLKVRVTSRSGNRLEVVRVSRSLYAVLVGGRGHEPFGKVQIPKRGPYTLRTSATDGSPGGRVTAGPQLWNPLGSPLVGAFAVGLAALLALLVLELPLLLAARSRAA